MNYLDKIPHILTGFRKGAIGISADIAKAFLQVSIKSADRDYLRFLWWAEESQTSIVEYRHCRLVFGLTSSPFLLSATISHHLNKATGKVQYTAQILAKSFYVDNCLTSLNTKEETSKFILEAKEVMSRAKFDLRQWVTSQDINETGKQVISVLGLLWDTENDELWCNLNNLPAAVGTISKKELMSLIQRIFDPIGFTCPATLVPRLLMQETWRRGLAWDEALPDDLMAEFCKWYEHINCLEQCRIPRRLSEDLMVDCAVTLHMFCDASKVAYGACVLLRSETEGRVNVQMLYAKARVAPPEKVSIPRLELMTALMGSRLLSEAKKSLGIEGIKEYCWTDSCVAFYWITRNLPWNVYVYNRVKEIRENCDSSNWYHIQGMLNWADVASRGCNAEQLLSLRWWEGPSWLRLSQEEWPKSLLHVDDTEACKELRKTKTACNATTICMKEGMERLYYFSKYTKIIRMVAWILRFKNNTLHKELKKKGDISVEEYEDAEKKIIKLIQLSEEEYITEQKKSLNTYQDDDGLIRIKTKLLLSDFEACTKFPVLLPAKNIIVRRLVEQRHRELKHAGANQLTADIRTRFWIIGIRRLAKSVISTCIICTRFRVKKAQAPTAPLPSERVECTAPFQVNGVDLAGPLFLRSGEKCWVVLFTCAVYRCVHLELTKSLSTDAFMLTLRRFIARRGRVQQIISDNGTNFQGTKNRLAEIDWAEIQKRSTIERIKWKMNVPTAPWWGGFFERLIRIMKELLRRILGQSRVNYEEMETVLCECEAVMNQRPLTYVQDDGNNSLEPLTPACFMQCIPHNDVTDLDAADAKTLNIRLKYILKLKEDFKQRFKMEYLTALVQRGKDKKTKLGVGDVVLIETEDKRVKWPLGVIEEIYTGNDGINRTAKIKTVGGYKLRPFQRLFPLEVSCSFQPSKQQSADSSTPTSKYQTAETIDEQKVNPTNLTDVMLPRRTRSGRIIKMPSKYTL